MKEYILNKWFFIVWVLASIFVLFDMKYNFFGKSEYFEQTLTDIIIEKLAIIMWACLSLFAVFKLIEK